MISLPGLFGVVDRIGHRALAHQPVPGDVLQRRHHLRHLGEDIGRAVVIPRQAHALADLLDDPEILPRIAGRLDHLARELHAAVGVGEGAALLGKRRGRQDHVGVERGLGDEEILHHQMVEHGQRPARMLQIGVRHRGVFALDIHAGDFAGMDRVHDLDHGQATHGIEVLMPELFKGLAQIGASDRLVVRQEHRDQAGVGSALHVVLAAQRMQAGAGTADLARRQRQRDQAARIVGAVDVLADAHAPEDDRGLRAGIDPRHFLQRLGRNAADRFHLLRREFLDALGEFVKAFGIARDILLVGQPFGDDGVQHRVQHRDVAAGLELRDASRRGATATAGADPSRSAWRRAWRRS